MDGRVKSILPKPPLKLESPSMQNKRRTDQGTPSGDYNKRQKSVTGSDRHFLIDSDGHHESPEGSRPSATGHRPVTSCTFCRQHKIKCNASERFPGACLRCEKMNLKCEIDPQFRPKKGLQIQTLKLDVNDLKAKMEV